MSGRSVPAADHGSARANAAWARVGGRDRVASPEFSKTRSHGETDDTPMRKYALRS